MSTRAPAQPVLQRTCAIERYTGSPHALAAAVSYHRQTMSIKQARMSVLRSKGIKLPGVHCKGEEITVHNQIAMCH